MPSVRLEPTTSAGERPQTYVLDGTTTGTGDISSSRENLVRRSQIRKTCGKTNKILSLLR